MVIHVLKTDPDPWDDVAQEDKGFEIRKDDRTPAFAKGDLVILVCSWGPSNGARVLRRIGYIYRGQHCPEGWCVFALDPPRDGDSVIADMATGKHEVSR